MKPSVLLTGASSGIGRATALKLGAAGFGFIGLDVLRLFGEDIGSGEKHEDRKGQDEDSAHGFPSQE